MPIAKIDEERRLVSGFATLDNIDKQSDIVPTNVSIKAFETFRGNLREMHQAIAVGKVINFRQEKFFDKSTEKLYNGVYVDAYISKGAQDTWEKVLDGTLSGFSIGGVIKDAENSWDENIDKTVRIVKDYELHELSLVDNPANQFANVVSIQKINKDEQNDGIIAKADLENVYWCENDGLVRLSEVEDSSCPSCEVSMKNIGFVETKDAEKAMTVKSLLNKFIGVTDLVKSDEVSETPQSSGETSETAIDNNASIAENNIKEENNVSEENTVVEDTVEEVAAEEAVAEAPAEETVEKSVDAVDAVEETVAKSADPEEASAEEVAEEVASDDVEVEKSVIAEDTTDSELVKAVDEIKVSVTEAVSELVSTIKSLNEEIAGIKKSVDTTNEEISAVKGNLEEFGKRVDGLEDDTAVRKSGDLGGVVQGNTIRKGSMWGGRFLNSADLYH
jgi:peptidoglycan hydrolase CwlO-like protein